MTENNHLSEEESLFNKISKKEQDAAEFLPKNPINLLMLCAYTDYHCDEHGIFEQVREFANTTEGKNHFENADNWNEWAKKDAVYSTADFARSLEQTFCDWLDCVLPENYAVNQKIILNAARLICYFDCSHRFSLRFPLVRLSVSDYFKALTGFMDKKVDCLFTHWLFRDNYHKHFSLVDDIISLSKDNKESFKQFITQEQASYFLFNQLSLIKDWENNHFYSSFAKMLAELYGFKLPSKNSESETGVEGGEEFSFFPYGMATLLQNSNMQHRYAAAHASGNSMDSEKRLITQLSCLKFPSFEAHHGIYRDDEEREYLGVNIIPKPSVVIQKISFGSTVQQETYLAFFPLDSKTEKQLITIEYKLKDEDCLEEYEISRTTT